MVICNFIWYLKLNVDITNRFKLDRSLSPEILANHLITFLNDYSTFISESIENNGVFKEIITELSIKTLSSDQILSIQQFILSQL